MGLQDEKVKSVSILMVKTTIYNKYIRKEGEKVYLINNNWLLNYKYYEINSLIEGNNDIKDLSIGSKLIIPLLKNESK